MSQYLSRNKALILLEDGTVFHGKSIGIEGQAFGELCFNTGMTGYQEIFTDPSYYGQLMVTTNAHIGNYGVLNAESESSEAEAERKEHVSSTNNKVSKLKLVSEIIIYFVVKDFRKVLNN